MSLRACQFTHSPKQCRADMQKSACKAEGQLRNEQVPTFQCELCLIISSVSEWKTLYMLDGPGHGALSCKSLEDLCAILRGPAGEGSISHKPLVRVCSWSVAIRSRAAPTHRASLCTPCFSVKKLGG